MSSYQGKHRKQSTVVKNVAKIGIAAAIVGVPTVVAAPSAGATNWDAVAQCESGGNWSTSTGNGFSGGLQFTPSTWKANGGSGSPQSASRSEQIRVAEKVKSTQGMGAWPNCGKHGGSSSSSSSKSTSSSDSSSSKKSSYSNSSSSSKKSSYTPSSSSSKKSSYSNNSSSKKSYKSYSSSKKSSGYKTYSSSKKSTSSSHYTVVSGDTLGKIASKQGVSGGWQKLYQLNKDVLHSANVITPGQTLDLR